MLTVITAYGTGWTVLLPSAVMKESEQSSDSFKTVEGSDTVRPVLDAVITVYMFSWWWAKVSPETCCAICKNIIKLYIVASCWTIIDIDAWCTGPWTQKRGRIFQLFIGVVGCAVAQLDEALCYIPEGHGFDPQWRHWNFSLTQSFYPHYDPEVNSASNKNEYQEYFVVGKGGWCAGLTNFPPSCPDCLEIWEP